MLFYNFKILATLFSSNHVWSNTFLHYNTQFCFFSVCQWLEQITLYVHFFALQPLTHYSHFTERTNTHTAQCTNAPPHFILDLFLKIVE